MDWYERAVKEVELDLAAGNIDNDEYYALMCDIEAQLVQEAEEAADAARYAVLGYR